MSIPIRSREVCSIEFRDYFDGLLNICNGCIQRKIVSPSLNEYGWFSAKEAEPETRLIRDGAVSRHKILGYAMNTYKFMAHLVVLCILLALSNIYTLVIVFNTSHDVISCIGLGNIL